MTIDPDDYDLRELRRIADERRDARRSDGADRRRRERSVRRPARRSEADRRNGRNGHHDRNGRERRRNGESADRPDDGHEGQEAGDAEGSADETVTVRPRDADGRGQHADRAAQDRAPRDREHDDVVRADRIARDLGFGDDPGGRRPDGRLDPRDRRLRADARRPQSGFEDDVGRFQFDTEVRERPRSRPGKVLRENQLEQLLVHETAASDGLSKPYLSDLPDAYAAERLLFDWLEFLVLKGGYKRTMDALRYYNTVGWLTGDVEVELRDYLIGFSGEVSDTEPYDVDDHHLSLVYIARLASMT